MPALQAFISYQYNHLPIYCSYGAREWRLVNDLHSNHFSLLTSYLLHLQFFPGRGAVFFTGKLVAVGGLYHDLGRRVHFAARHQVAAKGTPRTVADADMEWRCEPAVLRVPDRLTISKWPCPP